MFIACIFCKDSLERRIRMNNSPFYYCSVCGNIIEKVADSGNDLVCCGRSMIEMEAGITDGSVEFHIPVCEREEKQIKVCIGKNPHPMTAEHYIQWIELVTNKGIYRKYLEPGEDPCVKFKLCKSETPIEVYAYCNRHKLWKETF